MTTISELGAFLARETAAAKTPGAVTAPATAVLPAVTDKIVRRPVANGTASVQG